MSAKRSMPVPRKKLNSKSTRAKSKVLFVLGALGIFLGVILLIFLVTPLPGEQLTVVRTLDTEEVQVSHYDFSENMLTVISIPSETVVTAGYGYGEWRIGSLERLGVQENMGGELLRMSLVRTFGFPVTDWEGSLNLKEKLAIAWFTARLPEQNRNDITLEKTEAPSYLAALFTPPSDHITRIGVYDATGRARQTIEALSETLHLMGGDWAVIEQPASDTDCVVRGSNLLVSRVAKVFQCTFSSEPLMGNFDLEIVIGKKFTARF